MQLPKIPAGDKFHAVVKAIQYERLTRYMPASNGRIELAFQYYLWNSKLCESFNLVIQIAEVTCRNTFNNTLIARCGPKWFDGATVCNILSDRYRSELSLAVNEEHRQHKECMTANHVVSALTFGFWDHLATKRFDRLLWSTGVQRLFPFAPRECSRDTIHSRIESVRRWRNRIAHHRCIFDKSPMKRHAEALELIGWICPDTRNWVASQSLLPATIALRPR